ncbi:MAG: hypothetical protein DHS20C10_10300 [marine bacterium B5-7]|nr:MAG: hypothetical protein DHS20C10_10300 [marine bacterium B5-7]
MIWESKRYLSVIGLSLAFVTSALATSYDAVSQKVARDKLTATNDFVMPRVHASIEHAKQYHHATGAFPSAVDDILSSGAVSEVLAIDRRAKGVYVIQFSDLVSEAGVALKDRYIILWPSSTDIGGIAHLTRYFCTTNVDGGFLTIGATVANGDTSILSHIAGDDVVLSTCVYEDLDTTEPAGVTGYTSMQ